MKLTIPLYGIFLIFLICKNVYGQKIEKLYYNQSWKSCKKKEASFFRLVTFDDKGNSIGLVKDFYIVGKRKRQLMYESEATFIGKDDDSKTIWKGKSISYFLSGTKSAEIMRDDAGNLNGLSVRYFENSNKKEELNFKENIKNGEVVFYYSDGQVKEKGNFLDNKRTGIFTGYYQNGDIKYENKFLLDGEYIDEYGEKYMLTNIDVQNNKSFSGSSDYKTTLTENGELSIDYNKRFYTCSKTIDTSLSENFSIELKIRVDSILTSSNLKQGIVFNFESWENYSWFGADKYGEIFIKTVTNGSANIIWTNKDVPNRPSALNCPLTNPMFSLNTKETKDLLRYLESKYFYLPEADFQKAISEEEIRLYCERYKKSFVGQTVLDCSGMYEEKIIKYDYIFGNHKKARVLREYYEKDIRKFTRPIRFGVYENSFRIECHDDEYYFYINSEYVFQTNKTFFKPLSFGLLAIDYFDSEDEYSRAELGHNNNKYNSEKVGNISVVNLEIKRYQKKHTYEKLNEFIKLQSDSSLIIHEYKDNCYIKISEVGDLRKFIELAAHQKYDSLIKVREIDRLKAGGYDHRINNLLDHDYKTFQTIKSSLISNSIAPMVYAYIGPKSKYSTLGSKISSEDFKLLRSKKRFSFIYDYMPFYQTFGIQNKDYDKNEFIIALPGVTFAATDKLSIKQNNNSFDLNGKVDDGLFIFTLKSDYYKKIIPFVYANLVFTQKLVPTVHIKTANSNPLLICNLLQGCDSIAREDFFNAAVNMSFNNLHLIPSLSAKLDVVYPKFMGYDFTTKNFERYNLTTRNLFYIKMKEFIIKNENLFISNYKSSNRITKNILKGLYICFGSDKNLWKILLADNDVNNYDCQILNSLLSLKDHFWQYSGSILKIQFRSNKIVFVPYLSSILDVNCNKFSPGQTENELKFVNKAISLDQKNPLGYLFKALYSSNETIPWQNGDMGGTICSQCNILKKAFLYRSNLDSDYANEFAEMYDGNCISCTLCSYYIGSGRSIKTGKRGGKYYINSNGNKTYIKHK